MKIYTLMENTAVSEEFESRHGLSFYIETKRHKILFDMGPDETYLVNAKKLGVDISSVDIAFLSHGHYDHGGGLQAFLEHNSNAQVHMQRKAFGAYYSQDPDGAVRYIGLPSELKDNPRFVYHMGDYRIDEELQLFSGVTGRECYSPANDRLFIERNGRRVQDLFMHEQNLLIREDRKTVLVAGCAHNGIVNILKRGEAVSPTPITHVIGGFHLKNPYAQQEKQEAFCRELSGKLKQKKIEYHTCHCTGTEAYKFLKKDMGRQISYLAAGSVLEI